MIQGGNTDYSAIGGLGGGIGGFGGGIGLFGLLGLKGIGDLDGYRRGDDNCTREMALLAAIGNSKDTTVATGANLANAICDSEKTNLQQFYAGAIQAANNTQAIKDQATAFAIVTDKRFDDLTLAGVTQTAAILARINEAETQSLRDQLTHSHRRTDTQDISIAISNSNSQVQAQIQAQAQVQRDRDYEHARRFDALFSQVAKSSQDIINVGGLMAGVAQTANPVNVKS